MNAEQAKELLKDSAKMEEVLKKFFDELDKDKKGYLEPAIMKQYLMERARSLGFPPVEPPKEREERIRHVADPNNTGKVDFNGFKAANHYLLVKSKEIMKDPAKREAEVKRVFEELDKDKKGYLSIAVIEELEKKVDQFGIPIIFRLSEEEKNRIKKAGDPNSTGKLTFEGCIAIADAVAEKAKVDGLI